MPTEEIIGSLGERSRLSIGLQDLEEKVAPLLRGGSCANGSGGHGRSTAIDGVGVKAGAHVIFPVTVAGFSAEKAQRRRFCYRGAEVRKGAVPGEAAKEAEAVAFQEKEESEGEQE